MANHALVGLFINMAEFASCMLFLALPLASFFLLVFPLDISDSIRTYLALSFAALALFYAWLCCCFFQVLVTRCAHTSTQTHIY